MSHMLKGDIKIQRVSQVAVVVKNPPADARETQEMRVQSLGLEDPLEKKMANHSSILAWRISWTEEPAGYSPQGRKDMS